MFVGIGVGIGRNRFAQGIFNAYNARVVADGGITEAGQCVDAVTGLLLNASLLLIPSGYKGGKLYAEIPTNGNGDLTWTRGSDAFRTNASGVLQRVPWNLLQQSETFANAYWTKLNATITADTTTAPNGTTTADSIIESSSTGIQEIYRTPAPVTAGTYTYSVYVKNFSGTRFLNLSASATTSSDYVSVRFSPLTESLSGVVVSGTFSNGSASYTAVGNGWYRVILTFTTTSLPIPQLALSTDGTNGNVGNFGVQSYTGNGTSGLYIWGAQLVEGTTAQTYLPTTDRLNFPRLDYTYGSCPSALLEPQRTNLLTYSDDFSNAAWTKIASTVSTNSTTSPDGLTNADTFSANGTNAVHALYRAQTVTSATPYTFTIYAKANTGRYLLVRNMTSATYVRYGIAVDLQNGTVTQTSSTATAPSGTSNSVTNVGSGWYRISVTMNSIDTSYGVIVEPSNTGTPTLDAFLDYSYSGTESYYVFGAQLEQGAYPTTYIPTTSATATRVADSFSRNNIYTNGLISASGGTWFVELRGNVPYTRDAGANGLALSTDSGATTNAFFLRAPFGSSRIGVAKYVSGTFSEIYTTTSDTVKIAIKWNGTTADIFANGTKVISATSFTATALEFLNGNAADVPKFIQQMALYPTPLTDAQCQTLTT